MSNVKINLRGDVREFPSGVTGYEVAQSIGAGLAKAACAVSVNGEVRDLRLPIEEDCELTVLTFDDADGKHAYWHSTSHIMAQAIQHLYPQTLFTIGPAIENGFYYDIDCDVTFTPEILEKIEDEMKKIIKEDLPIERYALSREAALEKMSSNPYKVELISDLPEGEEISFYSQGDFTDLCAGPHIMSTGRIGAVKLLNVTGAYWRADANNKMLQRVYGISFPKASQLNDYLTMLEEARKRDHRKLGRDLGLFAFRDEAPGFPFYLPKGMVLKNTLIDYWRGVHKRWDYVEISTPQIMKRTLWETSGHWDHYKDNMYTTVIDDEDFAIKPMNCPGSILVYDLAPHSYRDLPLRYGELGLVHRHELSGALHGMFRVRCFTQDDAHILLAKDQIKDEVIRIAQLFDEVYSLFGLKYKIELSTMPDDHIGSVEDWDIATAALADAITSIGKEYTINPGDGAFYGPKLDFHISDCLNRTWQCGTIQLDYQLPGRFNIEYTGDDGEKHTPVMIHRVVFGSIERFIGIITEHFAGAFPTWLAPVQVKVIPISEKHVEYASKVLAELESNGIRAEADFRNEKMGYKIREAQLQKIPYMLVVGDKEAESGTVSLRSRRSGDEGTVAIDEFIRNIREEIDSRAL
ncbi:MAG: threonine--tRNA ligase [Oscillospiraceae bacterium]|nr:threonine--tRNA ligase [Oscillospiraceae bacterium]MBQ4240989.1 threonine--tRNA ligase [Oscillospiraceae bacterium]MBQ5411973.1 threonine--tRNA ligase [Oscillospiraceae bacterium]